MHNPQEFDYNQPRPDTLAGIYVEVSDTTVESPRAEWNAAQGEAVVSPDAGRLFGLTVIVDEHTAEHPHRTPQAG
jgi:hypothetical protein